MIPWTELLFVLFSPLTLSLEMKGASPKDDDGGLIWRAVTLFSKMYLFYSQKVRGRRRHVDVRKAQNEKTGKV